MNKPIHPAIAEHAMEENEKLRGLLQEALHAHRNPNRAQFPYDRITAALSQQAEPAPAHLRIDDAVSRRASNVGSKTDGPQ